MVKTSVLNDCLNAINNAEKAGKRQVMIRPSSKVIVKFLTVMQRHGTSQSYARIAHFFNSFLLPFFTHLPTSPPSFGLITRQ
jgi:ribosomal protein S8